ncbi:MAG: hypothetical protein HUU21_25105 [Polyangiaceae bacterium]|nr:hypothetical protein [Polyangiaceae bacterium]NUQ76827.1 hypothetical protein [Polyangiaceae bacterium]
MNLTKLSILLTVTSSLLWAACGDDGDGTGGAGGQVACTLEARSSVSVKVNDAMGIPVLDAIVTFSVDGGAEQDAECVQTAAAGGCEAWVAGWEVAGTFEIKAVSADGMSQDTETVVVTKDECHVISQSVTLTF